MKIAFEYDTEKDAAELSKLQALVNALNPIQIEKKKVELESLLESSPPIKQTGKVSWNFGQQEIDGCQVIIYYPEDTSDWQALNNQYNNRKGYKVKDPKGVVHIFPNLSNFCKKQGIFEYQNFNSLAAGRRKSAWNGWVCVKKEYEHIQPYLNLEKPAI